MAKFISRASTGCRRKALEGARGDRAGGCGATGREAAGRGRPVGTRQELARRHDAPSTSERATDLHARPEHTATTTAAAAARARAALPRTSPRALPPTPPGRFRLEGLSESQASSREDPALRLRPRPEPCPPHKLFSSAAPSFLLGSTRSAQGDPGEQGGGDRSSCYLSRARARSLPSLTPSLRPFFPLSRNWFPPASSTCPTFSRDPTWRLEFSASH